jgi:cell division protein FtsA
LKHLVQLTEYITGLGCRLGYPNEHLAGGHAEALMNPMYSTCIGLILRGYHDFESGRMRFMGEGGNLIHLEDAIPSINIDGKETAVVPEEMHELEEELEEKQRRRTDKMRRLFDGFKGKFMSFFEEVEDEEIE